jgi:hypothetical protein
MEETQKLFKEKSELEGTLPEIKRVEEAAVEDQSLRELVAKLEMSRIVFEVNDERTKDLQEELNGRVGAIRSKRKEYLKQHGEICKQLTSITTPIIRDLVVELIDHRQRAKVKSEILTKEYSGMRKTTILTVKSNKTSLIAFRGKVDAAVATIEGMRLYPISEIREKGKLLLREIQDFDWKAEKTEKIDESDYYRGGPPPAGTDLNYGGPMSP